MKHTTIYMVLVLAILSLASCTRPVTIYDAGDHSMWLNQTIDGENVSYIFQARVPDHYEILETVTNVCFKTDDSFEVNNDAEGFGLQWLCHAPVCTLARHYGFYLLSGRAEVNETSGDIVWIPVQDYSTEHVYTYGDDTVDVPSNTIAWNMTALGDANLPIVEDGITEFYKCFVAIGESFWDTNLLLEVNVSSWEEHNFYDGDAPNQSKHSD